MEGRERNPVETVGVIGAGPTGLSILGHLAWAGYRVRVYDVDPGRWAVVEEQDASWFPNLPALAAESQVILVCVDPDRPRRPSFSEQKLLQVCQRATVVAVLSMEHSDTVGDLAERMKGVGVHVLDATLSRGGTAEDCGTVLSVVGGSLEDVERIRPVLSAFSSDIVFADPMQIAQAAEAASNLNV